MNNKDWKSQLQQFEQITKPEPVLEAEVIAPGSIEEIILRYERLYQRIKTSTDRVNVKRHAKWWSVGSKECHERLAEDKAWLESDPNKFSVIPPMGFYRERLAPAIAELVLGDSAEFERVSHLLLKAIWQMAQEYVCQAASKERVIVTFAKQYLKFLHNEKDETVLAIAKMQANRVNLQAELDETTVKDAWNYAYEDHEVKQFLQAFSGSKLNGKITDFAQLCAGIGNGFVAQKFMQNIPKIVDALSNEDSCITEGYLALAKAIRFPADYSAFQFSQPESIGFVKKIRDTGSLAPSLLELVRLAFVKDRHISSTQLNLDELIENARKLVGNGHPEALDEAIYISQMGANGIRYIDLFDQIDKNTSGNRGKFLRYLVDIAKKSKECADSYLWEYGKEHTAS